MKQLELRGKKIKQRTIHISCIDWPRLKKLLINTFNAKLFLYESYKILTLNAEGATAAICKLFDKGCCISAG